MFAKNHHSENESVFKATDDRKTSRKLPKLSQIQSCRRLKIKSLHISGSFRISSHKLHCNTSFYRQYCTNT